VGSSTLEDFAVDHAGEPVAEPVKEALSHERDRELEEARRKIGDLLKSFDDAEYPQLIRVEFVE